MYRRTRAGHRRLPPLTPTRRAFAPSPPYPTFLAQLRDIITRLREVYASKVGVEYMHIWDYEQVSAYLPACVDARVAPLSATRVTARVDQLDPRQD